ncbi:MAG: hypothetical protein QNJ53_19480 [Pleurocapsa sp. MO_192.B19]|nr:hypothetical protein [Pleurocapsa sp. MO_192.B19]
MALAILRFQDNHGANNRFQVDIGVNRFYLYAIGDEELRRTAGLKVLSNPQFTSPLIGPLLESSLGRTMLEVPHTQFDRQNRYIQIISYRNQQREGAAISEIVKIPLISSVNDDLPAISFSQEVHQEITMENHSVDTVPFAYKETQPVSSAMFLGGLVSAISSVAAPVMGALKSVAAPVMNVVKQVASPLLNAFAPEIGKVAEGIIPGSGSFVNSAIPGMTNILAGASPADIMADPSKLQAFLPAILNNPTVAQKLSANPKTAQLLGTLMQQVNQNATVGQTRSTAKALAAVSNGNGHVHNDNNTLLSLERSLNLIPGTLTPSVSTAQEIAPANDRYVEEMSVPIALATCLPSMMPLMDKVMTRKMRRMLMDDNISDRKRMALITNGLMDITRGFRGVSRNYRGRDNYYRHAAGAFSLLETEDNKQANALVSGLSVGLDYEDPTIDYDRVESVKLDFVEENTIMMQGRSRLLYRQDETIAFPLEIETPRTITKGVLQLSVKDANTLEVLIEQKYRLEDITSGELPIVPELSAARLRSLEPNEEYLVCAVLVWEAKSRRSNRRKRVGTSMTQLITLVGEYCFDRLEGTGEVVPLNDVTRFRSYWHQIWEGEFDRQLRRTTLDCKYYYALEPERTNHARMETVTQMDDSTGTRQAGKLKTGLILSAYRLNELLGQISDYPMLNGEELTALLSCEFKEQFSHCARNSVEFSGRRGDVVGLWVYPEFKLQRILLKQMGQTNRNGQVLSLVEHTVYFPMPAVVHFIGVES